MKIINFLSFLIITPLFSCSQNLDCEYFKNGGFIISNDSEKTPPYKIIRKGEFQIEIDDKGIKRYSKIEWLDDCSYQLTYDPKKMSLNDFQKRVNNSGGIIVHINKIEGNCGYFTSIIKGHDSKPIQGVMCAE